MVDIKKIVVYTSIGFGVFLAILFLLYFLGQEDVTKLPNVNADIVSVTYNALGNTVETYALVTNLGSDALDIAVTGEHENKNDGWKASIGSDRSLTLLPGQTYLFNGINIFQSVTNQWQNHLGQYKTTLNVYKRGITDTLLKTVLKDNSFVVNPIIQF